jgi:hypothetical protein
VLDVAVAKTFGEKKKAVQVGEAAETWHLLDTYTNLPFVDNNFLITINNADHGREVLLKLLDWIHTTLQEEYRQDHLVPVLTVYVRHTKGIYYADGEGGIAPTAVSEPGQSILSIEPLTYTGLAKTEDYKRFLNGLKGYMQELNLSFKEHPGKTLTMDRLADNFTDEAANMRLKSFRDAIVTLHGGTFEHVERSPFMSQGKREYIFGDKRGAAAPDKTMQELFESTKTQLNNKELREQALGYIIQFAEQYKHTAVKREANRLLRG